MALIGKPVADEQQHLQTDGQTANP